MEFPHIGKHCGLTTCHRLDFLPVKCDACEGIFCHDHYSYRVHHCPSAYKKDVQVPVCPLCSQPVPTRRGESADGTVGRHIDAACAAVRSKPVYTNACSVPRCKRKELVPVRCEACRLNFCLGHRHEADHECRGPVPVDKTSMSAAGRAALARFFSQPRDPPPPPRDMRNVLQAGLSEEEALARALAESMGGASTPAQPTQASRPNAARSQEEEDSQLAAAIAASQQQAPRQRQSEKPCVLH